MQQTSCWLPLRTAHIAQAVLSAALLGLSACSGGYSSSGSPATADPPGNAYMLSATISGLNSAGLVLKVAGLSGGPAVSQFAWQEPGVYHLGYQPLEALVPIDAATTSLPIASLLPPGSAYTVTIKTQPAGETCSVAGGAGMIRSANVANVVVTCSDKAYAIGGTVSGLNGWGLMLANGGDTLAVSAGATSFTMPSAVAYTSSYAVTVQTQPAGLACAVQNSSDTMPAAPVTNISVTCTDQPFRLGGSISGLGNNTGLLLQNGSDALTVSPGSSSFTMPAAVSFGSSYSVVVQSSPAGLICTASHASGTMPAGNFAGIVVACSDRAYTVGGTISGLTTAGLVLANGSDTLAVSSGASAFTMPTAVAYTSAYDVTVQTQPAGLTCSVSSGTNTMGTSAVANIAVTCSANSYTVGGTISGLTGTGLVLLDNGGDATTISANATQFTMNTGVAYGSVYDITVQTVPPGLVCSVSYGTNVMGAADVTSVSIACGSNFTLLYSFAGGHSDGASPYHSLIQDSAGNFVGSTLAGGASSGGTIFEISPDGTENILYSFASMPWAGLIQGNDGNFYGTTAGGGTNGRGTFFELTAGGTESVLYSFPKNGSDPYCGVIQGSDGNFYGTTGANGTTDDGTVFQLTPSGTETVLHAFPRTGNSDGQTPYAGVIQGSDGNLYGTTYNGGSSGEYGTVFKVTLTGTETVLYAFAGGTDGQHPYAGLVQGSDGNFYGTTYQGGANGLGTVFKVTPTGVESIVYSFAGGSDGANPQAGLIQGSDGNLYGMTYAGGASNLGTVFKLTLTGTETVLHTFAGGSSDGANPWANLVQGSDGNLYGTTYVGGASDVGTFFKVTLQ